jgi:hypothetical protein
MSHSLIGADGRTHCKIVAVALASSMSLIMLALAVRHVEPETPTALARANGPVFKAGKPTISAVAAAPIIR